MNEFIHVAKLSDIPDPGKRTFEVDDRLVVLIRAGEQVFCLEDLCTHDGGPLSDGSLNTDDMSIACPRHGAKFDIQSGRHMTMPATEPTILHEAKVQGDDIFVKINNDK